MLVHGIAMIQGCRVLVLDGWFIFAVASRPAADSTTCVRTCSYKENKVTETPA